MKQKGLGRGLDAIFGSEHLDARLKPMTEMAEISVSAIFPVPEGYFENLTSEVMNRLPEKEKLIAVQTEPTMWQKVRPWLYMTCLLYTSSPIKDFVLIGNLTQLPQCREVFSKMEAIYHVGLSGVPPDMSGAPENSNFKLVTFGNFHRPLRYNSPDCPVCAGHVRCSKEGRPQELGSLGFSFQPLRYNSPDCPVCTGLSGASAEQRLLQAPTATCSALIARQRVKNCPPQFMGTCLGRKSII